MKLMLRLSIASCLLISVLGAPSLEASAVISPLKQYVMTDGYRNMRLSVDKPIAGALDNVPENAIIEFYINEICVGTLTLSQLKNSQESRIAINESIPIGIYEKDIYENTIDETNIRVAYQIIDKKNNKTYKGNSYPLNKDKDYYEEMKFITGYKSKKTFIEAIRLNISKASREEGGILIAIASYKRNSFSAVAPSSPSALAERRIVEEDDAQPGSSAPSSPSALAERRIVEDDAQPGAPPSPVSGARATATPSK